jgi:methyl-accepting chemotaxis protein
VEKVGTGSKLVEDAGQTMDRVVASVKQVTDIVGEISAASQEQSDGIEQVNQAVTQMDEVTQQNAALVEEAAAAAQAMQEQAAGLLQTVSIFKTGITQPAAAAIAAAPVAARDAHATRSIKAPRPSARPVLAAISAPRGETGDSWEQF